MPDLGIADDRPNSRTDRLYRGESAPDLGTRQLANTGHTHDVC